MQLVGPSQPLFLCCCWQWFAQRCLDSGDLSSDFWYTIVHTYITRYQYLTPLLHIVHDRDVRFLAGESVGFRRNHSKLEPLQPEVVEITGGVEDEERVIGIREDERGDTDVATAGDAVAGDVAFEAHKNTPRHVRLGWL